MTLARVRRPTCEARSAARKASPSSTPGGLAHVNLLLNISCRDAGHYQACRQAGEEASPDHGDSRDRSTAGPIFRGQPCMCWFGPAFAIALGCAATRAGDSASADRPGLPHRLADVLV